MSPAYLLKVTEGFGSPQLYVVDQATFNAAEAADDGEEGFMEWFYEQETSDWPLFHGIGDLNNHLNQNSLELKGELEGYLY